ncbi:hypothetical protein R6Z07F_015293 [Ovis aries]
MELHILEHRVRVLSLARPGLWLYTHPLIKLLFLPRRSRAAPVRVPASGRGHVAGAECVVSQRCGRTGRRGHQDRPISDRTAGRAPRVRADAVHLPDRLHPGAGAGPVRGDPHAGPGIRHLPRGGRRACACCQGRFQQWLSPCPACPPREAASGSPGSSSITFFAFSLIEGYISIVMDAETQKKFPSDLLLTSSSGELWRMTSVGSWPRLRAPWLRPTSPPTTSAPSTLTMPWCPRMASAASSRFSSAGRTAWAPEAPGAGHSSPRDLPLPSGFQRLLKAMCSSFGMFPPGGAPLPLCVCKLQADAGSQCGCCVSA